MGLVPATEWRQALGIQPTEMLKLRQQRGGRWEQQLSRNEWFLEVNNLEADAE